MHLPGSFMSNCFWAHLFDMINPAGFHLWPRAHRHTHTHKMIFTVSVINFDADMPGCQGGKVVERWWGLEDHDTLLLASQQHRMVAHVSSKNNTQKAAPHILSYPSLLAQLVPHISVWGFCFFFADSRLLLLLLLLRRSSPQSTQLLTTHST